MTWNDTSVSMPLPYVSVLLVWGYGINTHIVGYYEPGRGWCAGPRIIGEKTVVIGRMPPTHWMQLPQNERAC